MPTPSARAERAAGHPGRSAVERDGGDVADARRGRDGARGRSAGLSRAPLWGLVRSARAEHPDRRLQLVDVDAPLADAALLAELLSTAAEPELALRHGVGGRRRGWCVRGRHGCSRATSARSWRGQC